MLNPINLANVMVKNIRIKESEVIVDNEYHVTITLDNPNNYGIQAVVINNVTYSALSINEDNTLIDVPMVAPGEPGDVNIDLNAIQYTFFRNQQNNNTEMYEPGDVTTVATVENYDFVQEIKLDEINLDTSEKYVEDLTSLEFKIDNPNGYEITTININDRDYDITDFEVNEDNTVVTLPWLIGTNETEKFELKFIEFNRLGVLAKMFINQSLEFSVGNHYLKIAAAIGNPVALVWVLINIAPKVDWLFGTQAGQISIVVLFVVTVGGWLYYTYRKRKSERGA